MSDIYETPEFGGCFFDLNLRQVNDAGEPERWVAWISVQGKEPHLKGNSASFTGLSDGDVREQAERWMRRWRN
jgi:hypothetical protein